MVLRNKDVIIDVRSNPQAARLQNVFKPTKTFVHSSEFKNQVSTTAQGFIQAQNGLGNLKKLLNNGKI
ncbi:hypothetical protein [Leuconostoc gasicomitatum]|uniref:hypothetical protein n=1 Tax=Leuconostoc gasicomitatum TaxID=115778 RepID=UPI0007448444|nr:hypothetical protein [Leuconostoc gasicomitatum]CUR63470.1 Uncharacterized protein LEKG_0883 [Leuconostoc gasicomitatum KG16-1]